MLSARYRPARQQDPWQELHECHSSGLSRSVIPGEVSTPSSAQIRFEPGLIPLPHPHPVCRRLVAAQAAVCAPSDRLLCCCAGVIIGGLGSTGRHWGQLCWGAELGGGDTSLLTPLPRPPVSLSRKPTISACDVCSSYECSDFCSPLSSTG